jgi:hypothetical protein
MPIEEQQKVREKYYAEAVRYMDKAKETLQKAGKDEEWYAKPRYVRRACGTAYKGVLIALDTYLLLHGMEKTKKARSMEFYYCWYIDRFDKELSLNAMSAYQILHLSGQCDGNLYINTIQEGFNIARLVIDKIKPTIMNH